MIRPIPFRRAAVFGNTSRRVPQLTIYLGFAGLVGAESADKFSAGECWAWSR
jgi:hypothetical protein